MSETSVWWEWETDDDGGPCLPWHDTYIYDLEGDWYAYGDDTASRALEAENAALRERANIADERLRILIAEVDELSASEWGEP